MYEEGGSEQQAEVLDVREILQAFGVEDWLLLDMPEAPGSETFQTLVEIAGQRYILRERPETMVAQEGEHSYLFQRYLGEQGIPVVPFRLTPQGRPYVTVGEDAFELLEWRAGELFDSSSPFEPSWIASAGEMLGRLHQAARGYAGPDYRWPSEVQAGGLTQGWLHFARERAEQIEVYALATAISHMVEAWEAALPAAMMAIGTGRNLPEFPIHGDYSALNLRFHEQGVSAVMGLEASRREKRLLEVAYAVFAFAGLAWHANGLTRPRVPRGLDPTRASWFLGTYGAKEPPVPGEAALLVDALTLVAPILTINGPLEDLFYPSDPAQELPVEDLLERLAWASSLPAWLARVRQAFAQMW